MSYKQVYQFKIILKHIKPPIWRRILVPENYYFWDLHVAIQNSMGWFDDHLHEFYIRNPITGKEDRIGIPDDDYSDSGMIPEENCEIKKYFSPANSDAEYTYDFGDNWEHKVKFEQILPRDPKLEYPICTAGKRACPPEDVGGAWGYMEFLKVINNPDHENYDEMVEWIGDEFDSESFDPTTVFVDDTKKH